MVVYPKHGLKVETIGGGTKLLEGMKRFLDNTCEVEVEHIVGVGDDLYYSFDGVLYWFHKSFFKNGVRLV